MLADLLPGSTCRGRRARRRASSCSGDRDPATSPWATRSRDVTVGNNDLGRLIDRRVLGCCTAHTGYDLATGLGSANVGVNVAALAHQACCATAPRTAASAAARRRPAPSGRPLGAARPAGVAATARAAAARRRPVSSARRWWRRTSRRAQVRVRPRRVGVGVGVGAGKQHRTQPGSSSIHWPSTISARSMRMRCARWRPGPRGRAPRRRAERCSGGEREAGLACATRTRRASHCWRIAASGRTRRAPPPAATRGRCRASDRRVCRARGSWPRCRGHRGAHRPLCRPIARAGLRLLGLGPLCPDVSHRTSGGAGRCGGAHPPLGSNRPNRCAPRVVRLICSGPGWRLAATTATTATAAAATAAITAPRDAARPWPRPRVIVAP